MRVLVIDPGKNSGWAYWDTEISNIPQTFGEESKEGLFFLVDFHVHNSGLDFLVHENYRIRTETYQKGFAHRWDTCETARVIGGIECLGHLNSIEVVSQESSALKVGAGYGGIPVPKGHIKDHLSAMAHGFYFLVKRGVIQPIGQQKKP